MYDIFFIGKRDQDNQLEILKEKFPTIRFANNVHEAQKICLTKFFWVVWDDLIINQDFLFDYKPDNWSLDLIHVFKNNNFYDGILLIPKNFKIVEEELLNRSFSYKKEVDIFASYPKSFDYFNVDTYDEYTYALENSATEMFWMGSRNIDIDKQLIKEFYISHHDSQLRNQTHAFIHKVDKQHLYNGLFLCNKQGKLTEREINHRFPITRIEHDIIGSGPINYDIYEIDTYDEYLDALNATTTEMFWGTSRNIKIANDFKFDLYFTHDNEYDRKHNHAFIHLVNDKQSYDGVFLFSKHKPITEREIEHRHLIERKEWDIIASGPKLYDQFVIDTYDEYLHALENSTTEIFWGTSRNIKIADDFKFDLYFDNRTDEFVYERNENHAFIHLVNDKQSYDGVFLFSKHKPITKREIEHRHIIERKEWDIIASGLKLYDQFTIDTYDEYLHALENSTTEMFWGISRNIEINKNFKFDLYFTHDNDYDRKQNHAFIHLVNDKQSYDGVFLFSKHKPITKREIEHRHLVERKEWDIVASGPKLYDQFTIDTYDEYLYALENSTTEMFWATSRNIKIADDFKFDLYFDNRTDEFVYERNENHAFVHKDGTDLQYNGLFLFSKKTPITAKEIEHRHLINYKSWNVTASEYKIYDVVFISYQEPDADYNYEQLLKIVPNAKRVHGVKGIHQAHIAAAQLCETEMFWIVDGDAQLMDDFKFDVRIPKWDRDAVHVWRSQNPINDLVYGYGGVKLFPRLLTINMDTSKPDMTTSITNKFKAVNKISNITAFNTDPFSTWRSAFRECVKLSSKIIDRQKNDETNERLNIWCTKGSDKPFGSYAIEGAKAGTEYGIKYKDSPENLRKINNFDWLQEQFDARNF